MTVKNSIPSAKEPWNVEYSSLDNVWLLYSNVLQLNDFNCVRSLELYSFVFFFNLYTFWAPGQMYPGRYYRKYFIFSWQTMSRQVHCLKWFPLDTTEWCHGYHFYSQPRNLLLLYQFHMKCFSCRKSSHVKSCHRIHSLPSSCIIFQSTFIHHYLQTFTFLPIWHPRGQNVSLWPLAFTSAMRRLLLLLTSSRSSSIPCHCWASRSTQHKPLLRQTLLQFWMDTISLTCSDPWLYPLTLQ